MVCISVLAKPAKGLGAPACALILATSLLAACGGGGGGDAPASNADGDLASASAVTSSVATPPTKQEAARFLTQATFGPTPQEVTRLQTIGYSKWLQEQFTATTARSYKTYWEARNTAIKAVKPTAAAHINEINHVFWTNAISSPDQLRQRVAFALSQIFVISTQDGCAENHLSGAAAYFDMLGQKAFGTYRDLLQSVALHPVMGCYLSHLRNQKEDMTTGRVPDENFAREIMQLFSIGLYELNPDGSYKLSGGQPIDTYKPADVAGLAKVFTGWGLDCPGLPADPYDSCFRWGVRASDQAFNPDRWAVPMKPYAKFHSTSEKRFLTAVIPPQTSGANPQASLNVALDTLSKHPNVGPFIGKQMIQRLVTSNPSPDYVRRVSTAFTASGGSLKAMVTAILTDPEARSNANLTNPQFGKVREPILRMSALLRAYGAQSATGSFLIWNTGDPATSLGQNPFQAPSVFNFFRPGYTPPGSQAAAVKLVAPEMQLVNETSAAGYVNLMRTVVGYGFGMMGYENKGTAVDVTLEYQRNPSSATLALANQPAVLVEDVNQRLMYGMMPYALRNEIVDAITSIDTRAKVNPTPAQIADTYKRRVWAAVLLTMASPEFQVQK